MDLLVGQASALLDLFHRIAGLALEEAIAFLALWHVRRTQIGPGGLDELGDSKSPILGVFDQGKLESFYFAFGATDAFIIVELPDNIAAGGVAAAVAASGGVSSLNTIVLMTSEDGEQVLRKAGQLVYARPGSQ